MKPQDILFLLVLAVLLFKRNPYYLVWAGLLCIVVSIPLFAKYVFFTAEHLVWYAAAFFLVAIILFLIKNSRDSHSGAKR